MNEHWVNVDFRPAPTGWRIAMLNPERRSAFAAPMPGWVIQEELHSKFDTEMPTSRRIVAAMDINGEICAANDSSFGFWKILGPTEPDPDADEIQEALEELGEAILEAREEVLRNAASAH